ncbi:MAG: hypothetical protein CMJ98_07265 [Planctomycetes bacterium]|nr:hypothetical protein [Planctomycetota bacterium]
MPRHTASRFAPAAIATLMLVFGWTEGAVAAKEGAAFGVNNFSGSGECGSADLRWSDEFIDGLLDALDDHGWDSTERWMNSAVDGRDWTDSSLEVWGADENDPYAVDHADVGMISSHGAHVHSSAGYYSYFVMGDDNTSEDCRPNSTDQMLFGNTSAGDLEVLILAACQTAHHDVWTDGGYFHVRERDGSLSTWLGFHGDSYDSRSDANRMEDYAQTSFYNGLGDNWIDEMYRNPIGWNNTQCPTAVVFCEDGRDCDRQFDYGGFDDRFKVALSDVKRISTYYYISGCNPSNGGTLP